MSLFNMKDMVSFLLQEVADPVFERFVPHAFLRFYLFSLADGHFVCHNFIYLQAKLGQISADM